MLFVIVSLMPDILSVVVVLVHILLFLFMLVLKFTTSVNCKVYKCQLQ